MAAIKISVEANEPRATGPKYDQWPADLPHVAYVLADGAFLCVTCANGGNGSLAGPQADEAQWRIIGAQAREAQESVGGETEYTCAHCDREIPRAPEPRVPTPDPAYRVIVEYDAEGQVDQDGSDGKPLPESPGAYADSPCFKDGVQIPYAEYVEYLGNPDRHTILMARVEAKCPTCGQWRATNASLGFIDVMDDQPDAGRVGTYSPAQVDAWPSDSYLREVCRELLSEARSEAR